MVEKEFDHLRILLSLASNEKVFEYMVSSWVSVRHQPSWNVSNTYYEPCSTTINRIDRYRCLISEKSVFCTFLLLCSLLKTSKSIDWETEISHLIVFKLRKKLRICKNPQRYKATQSQEIVKTLGYFSENEYFSPKLKIILYLNKKPWIFA